MENRKINKIEQQGAGYFIYLEDNDCIELDEETYFKYSIYEKEYLDVDFINEVVLQSEIGRCVKKARSYLTYGRKTENKMRVYLQDKAYSESAIEEAVYTLIKEGKIDDDEYIRRFFQKNKNENNRIKLISKLIYQGIDESRAIQEVDKVLNIEEDFD